MLHGTLDGRYLAKIVHVVHMTCQLIETWQNINSMEPAVFLSLQLIHFIVASNFRYPIFFLPSSTLEPVIIYHLRLYCMIRIFSVFLSISLGRILLHVIVTPYTHEYIPTKREKKATQIFTTHV